MGGFNNCWYGVLAVFLVLQGANYNVLDFPATIVRNFAACTNPQNGTDQKFQRGYRQLRQEHNLDP